MRYFSTCNEKFTGQSSLHVKHMSSTHSQNNFDISVKINKDI